MFWFTLIMWAASFAISEVMAADAAKKNSVKKSTLGDFTFPTASEERRIPRIWGKIKQSGPNVIWYGNLRQKAKKVKSSMFSKTTVGYYYYMGLQFGICKGPAILRKIWYGDTLIWTGTQSAEGFVDINKPPEFEVDSQWPTWFQLIVQLLNSIIAAVAAYDKVPSGLLYFYPGTMVQTENGYLAFFQNPNPSYRGLCYAIFDGYIGETTTPEPWSFEMECLPNGLGLADPLVGEDLNPMCVAYQIFTEDYGYPSSDIDVAGWQAAAATLLAEGNGFSWIRDSPGKASDVIKEIEVQIDGHFYMDASSGQWKIKLVRADYSVGDLPVLNSSNVSHCTQFNRGAWTGCTNEVRVSFNNRANQYSDTSSVAQDLANMTIQGKRIPLTIDMPGVRASALAGKLAWRELRGMSFPLATARVEVDRTLWYGYVGMPLIYNYQIDIPIVMRITKINAGKALDEVIEIELMQDVFTVVGAGFDTPDTGWTPPVFGMSEFMSIRIMEAPYAKVRREDDTTATRLWPIASDQYDGATGFIIRVDGVDGGDVDELTAPGALDGDITQTTTTIDITCSNIRADQFVAGTAATIGGDLVNLILVGDELIAPTAVADTATGIQLTGCYRGMCDTAQAIHSDTDPVWFVYLGAIVSTSAFTAGSTVDVKLIPKNTERQVADVDVTAVPFTFTYREIRPYPPSLLALNSTAFPASVDIDSDVAITFNRRDRRILNEVSQLAVDANTIDPTFPAAESTQYKAVLYVGGTEVWSGDYNAGAASLTLPLVKIIRYCVGCPATLEAGVRTRHNTTYESLQDIKHEATVISALSNDIFLGICDTGQISEPWTAPANGDYYFTLDKALDADLQVKVNGGVLTTVITAGLTAGTLVGVTAGDIIEVRHDDSTTSDEALLTIDAPGVTMDAYAVLIFENNYWQTGGFGRLGFGLGKFGR